MAYTDLRKKGLVDYAYKSIWIPLPFLTHCIKNGLIGEAAVFIALKFRCNGQIKLSGRKRTFTAIDLDISSRTLRRKLAELIKLNWIGYQEENGWYFVRGFERIYEIEDLKGRSCVEFIPKWLNSFEGFSMGAIIGHLVKQQIKKDWQGKECKTRRSNANSCQSGIFKPVATDALTQILGLSYSTAYKLKQKAIDKKFIKKDNPKKHCRKLGVKANQKKHFLKIYPEREGKIYSYKGELYEKSIDHFKSELKYKSLKRYPAP